MAKPIVQLQDLGLIDYKSCWDLQEKLNRTNVNFKIKRAKGEEAPALLENFLIACQHPPVYTLGKSGDLANLLIDEQGLESIGAEYYHINRGGDITYHGPGQLVVYPIFDLEQFFTDLHKFLRYLEEAVILTIAEYGLKGERLEGATGVWLDADIPEKARKICAIGIRMSRWVSMHGLALNVNTNLDYFKQIVPCGIDDKAVTSMEKELGRKLDFEEVTSVLRKQLQTLFDYEEN